MFTDGDFIDYRIGSLLDVEDYDRGPKLHKSFPMFRTQFNKYEETPPPHLPFQPIDGKYMLKLFSNKI